MKSKRFFPITLQLENRSLLSPIMQIDKPTINLVANEDTAYVVVPQPLSPSPSMGDFFNIYYPGLLDLYHPPQNEDWFPYIPFRNQIDYYIYPEGERPF